MQMEKVQVSQASKAIQYKLAPVEALWESGHHFWHFDLGATDFR